MAKGATLTSGSALLPDVGMSQSSLILASVLGGFVVWLMMNQKLAVYWSILMGGSTTTPSGGGTVVPGLTVTSPLYQGGGAAPSGGGIVPGAGGTLQLNPGVPLFGGSSSGSSSTPAPSGTLQGSPQ